MESFVSHSIYVDIPIEELYVYQILAKKHGLKTINVDTGLSGDSYRISFYLKGERPNKESFLADTDLVELYLDKIDKLFGLKK